MLPPSTKLLALLPLLTAPCLALPKLRATNNPTWIVYDTEFTHPGPALTRQPENVGGIGFNLRRTVQHINMTARTLTYEPVDDKYAVHCAFGLLDRTAKSEWHECVGYMVDNVPPGDETLTEDLGKRIRFRLSGLNTTSAGKFQSVNLEIVNHAVPKEYPRGYPGNEANHPSASQEDPVVMVSVLSTGIFYEAPEVKCRLREEDVTEKRGWEECSFGARNPVVQEEHITEAAFESKYWKLGKISVSSPGSEGLKEGSEVTKPGPGVPK